MTIEYIPTGTACSLDAGWYSRRWSVGEPWWSPDGEWLLCSWYTTKHVDHGWVSAISRTQLLRRLETAADTPDALRWEVTGHPNGAPYPEDDDNDERGTWEPVPVAAFAADSRAVFFADAHSVAGFSFPHFVPLFRVPRHDLAIARRFVATKPDGVAFIAWSESGRLSVASAEGRLGSSSNETE